MNSYPNSPAEYVAMLEKDCSRVFHEILIWYNSDPNIPADYTLEQVHGQMLSHWRDTVDFFEANGIFITRFANGARTWAEVYTEISGESVEIMSSIQLADLAGLMLAARILEERLKSCS